jgi:hypothetical protein
LGAKALVPGLLILPEVAPQQTIEARAIKGLNRGNATDAYVTKKPVWPTAPMRSIALEDFGVEYRVPD